MTLLASPNKANEWADPHAILLIFPELKLCTGRGLSLRFTSPRPSCPFLYWPQAQSIFLDSFPSPSIASTCASPHATVFIWIPWRLLTWVGMVISDVYIWPTLAFSRAYMSLKTSSPSYPRSFIPHPNNSPVLVKKREKVEPQKILAICSSLRESIFRGSGTLLFSMPRPGSKLSEENPSPS